MPETLAQALDGAKFVKIHPEMGDIIAVWQGGHTVNLYQSTMVMNKDRSNPRVRLDNFDCFTVGDFSENSASLQEVKDGIQTYFSEL